MKLHRFYSGPEGITGSVLILPPDESHHLSQVLRLRPGDEAVVFDGRGNQYRCRVTVANRSSAKLQVLEPAARTGESPLDLTLGQALAKGDKFDLIVQKATELGVTAIVPIITERSEVRLSLEQAERRAERWRRISLESVKQCGRSRLVEISSIVRLEDCFEQIRSADPSPELAAGGRGGTDSLILFCNERGGSPMRDALAAAVHRRVAVLVGPEGGWDDPELDTLHGEGCTPVSLGPRTLRMETAAIAAITLVQEDIGDLRRSGETPRC